MTSNAIENAAGDANAAPARKTNAMMSCCEQPIDVVIGLFFDGTGNNREVDSRLAALDSIWAGRARASALEKLEKARVAEKNATESEHERLFQKRHKLEKYAKTGSPVTNGPSNIVRLFDLYNEDREAYQYKFYIKGIGTFDAAKCPKEYTKLGMGFGLGREGGFSRILQAKERVLRTLREIGCKPDSVTFDIFGFSRGAALARHFVNVILAGVPDVSQKKEPYKGAKPFPAGNLLVDHNYAIVEEENRLEYHSQAYASLEDGVVKIRFVGLFDTVGSFYWPGNDRDGEFILTLPNGCAERVVHLVARDERRRNFRGTSIFARTAVEEKGEHEESGWAEITLAGVHSDIGGGYPLVEKTLHLMDKTPPFFDNFHGAVRTTRTQLLTRAKKEGLLTDDGVLKESYCLEKERQWGKVSPIATRTSRWLLHKVKHTENGYANHCLRIMYGEAEKFITDLEDIDLNPDNAVPTAVKTLLNDPSKEQELWEKYLHVSAVDAKPVELYSSRPLGYYSNNSITRLSMALQRNPKGPRAMLPNK